MAGGYKKWGKYGSESGNTGLVSIRKCQMQASLQGVTERHGDLGYSKQKDRWRACGSLDAGCSSRELSKATKRSHGRKSLKQQKIFRNNMTGSFYTG